jgi:protein-arginine kinase activator protein McsA
MLCCLCKERDAKVHLSQYEGAEEPTEANLVAKFDLCEDCARKHRVNDPNDFSLNELIKLAKKARGE